MDRIHRWKLADELTAYQIALLIAGYDPSEFDGTQQHMWPEDVKLETSAFLNAIKNAARSNRFTFKAIEYENNYGDNIDWDASTINVDSLCEWLRKRNFADGFFIQTTDDVDKVADPAGQFYAPKLAAALRAWNEVTSQPELLNGKTPKKALEVWLRKHANEYGLTGKDGNPNELGIEEICKVANWKPAGGASPTPVATTPPPDGNRTWVRRERPLEQPSGGKVRQKPPTPRPTSELDDDIPF